MATAVVEDGVVVEADLVRAINAKQHNLILQETSTRITISVNIKIKAINNNEIITTSMAGSTHNNAVIITTITTMVA